MKKKPLRKVLKKLDGELAKLPGGDPMKNFNKAREAIRTLVQKYGSGDGEAGLAALNYVTMEMNAEVYE